jgi:hypothetical protein
LAASKPIAIKSILLVVFVMLATALIIAGWAGTLQDAGPSGRLATPVLATGVLGTPGPQAATPVATLAGRQEVPSITAAPAGDTPTPFRIED